MHISVFRIKVIAFLLRPTPIISNNFKVVSNDFEMVCDQIWFI